MTLVDQCPAQNIDDHEAGLDDYVNQLARRAQEGDEDALRELIPTIEHKVGNVAHTMMDGSAQADDVAGAALAKVYIRGIMNGQYSDGTFLGWIHRVAVNTALDALRRQQRIRITNTEAEDLDEILERHAAVPSAEEGAVEQETSARINAMLAATGLAQEFSQPLIMHVVYGIPYEEIAATLNENVGTIRSRIHRAKLKLRDRPELVKSILGS